MIGADFQSLVLAHEETNAGAFFVFEKLGLTNTAFLPFAAFVVEAIELALAARRKIKNEKTMIRAVAMESFNETVNFIIMSRLR
jgi:hypothetical protein